MKTIYKNKIALTVSSDNGGSPITIPPGSIYEAGSLPMEFLNDERYFEKQEVIEGMENPNIYLKKGVVIELNSGDIIAGIVFAYDRDLNTLLFYSEVTVLLYDAKRVDDICDIEIIPIDTIAKIREFKPEEYYLFEVHILDDDNDFEHLKKHLANDKALIGIKDQRLRSAFFAIATLSNYYAFFKFDSHAWQESTLFWNVVRHNDYGNGVWEISVKPISNTTDHKVSSCYPFVFENKNHAQAFVDNHYELLIEASIFLPTWNYNETELD